MVFRNTMVVSNLLQIMVISGESEGSQRLTLRRRLKPVPCRFLIHDPLVSETDASASLEANQTKNAHRNSPSQRPTLRRRWSMCSFQISEFQI